METLPASEGKVKSRISRAAHRSTQFGFCFDDEVANERRSVGCADGLLLVRAQLRQAFRQ
jgi:hypothetical protein